MATRKVSRKIWRRRQGYRGDNSSQKKSRDMVRPQTNGVITKTMAWSTTRHSITAHTHNQAECLERQCEANLMLMGTQTTGRRFMIFQEERTLVPDYLRRRPQYPPISLSRTNSGPTPTCAPIARGQGLKPKFGTVVCYGGQLGLRPRQFPRSGVFLGFSFQRGTCPCGPPHPLLESGFHFCL